MADPLSVFVIAYNPADDSLYGVEESTGVQLVKIDRTTGAGVRIGTPDPLAPRIRSIAFDHSGRLFAAVAGDPTSDQFVEMNPVTGQIVSNLGSIGYTPLFGMAFDLSSTLYGAQPVSNTESRLLKLNPATGLVENDIGARRLLVGLTVKPPQVASLWRVEDFTDDADPSQPGLASTDFLHTFSGPEWMFADETAVPVTSTPYPSSPHALWLFIATDTMTFPGLAVDAVKVHVSTEFTGGAQVVVHGSGDVKTFDLFHGLWRVVEIASTDLGDSGNPMGLITSVSLAGGEALFDDIEIRVR